MHSKRQLYKPSQKHHVGQKKTGKLVQGRLVTTSSMVGQTGGSVVESNSASASRDTREDPTLSPCRSVPAVTEFASPRAEPLSKLLDLSDAELNLSFASSTSTSKQQAIMVCDASHLASSSDNTEVEVIVNYANSPARVICHTPRSARQDLSEVKDNAPVNVSSISIHVDSMGHNDSRNNSSSSYLPRSSSPSNLSKQYTSSLNSNFNSMHSAGNFSNNKSSPESTEFRKPETTRQLHFDEDDDVSSSKNTTGSDRIDRRPKIEAAKAEALKRNQTESDSDSCSLYEYVTNTKNSISANAKQADLKNVPKGIVKTPKRKQRVVQSRYMASAAPGTNKQQTSHRFIDSSLESSQSRNESKLNSRHKVINQSISASRNRQRKGHLTSTPTHDYSSCSSEIDASSIHQISTTNLLEAKDIKSKVSSLAQQQLNLDLWYTRYHQVQFMNTQAQREFCEQEEHAMQQLHGLWTLREKRKAELAQSKMELDRLKCHVQTYDALDQTETPLASLEEKAAQVVQDYSKLCSAVGNTMHQISTKDIYIPKEEEREAYDEKMESALGESNRILNKIADKISHSSTPLHQYVSSLEAINGNVKESGKELQEGHKTLDEAMGLCSRLLSTMVLDKQNSERV